MLDTSSEAAIPAVKDNIARISQETSPLKDSFEWCTYPLSGADGLVMPGLTLRTRYQRRATVTRTL